MRDPHTLTGRYECSESLNLGGSTYRQTTHILQINTQMHTFRLLPTGRRPSEQHSACHLNVSSGQAAALGKYGFFLKQPLYMSKQLKDFSNQFVVIDYLVTGLGDFFLNSPCFEYTSGQIDYFSSMLCAKDISAPEA